MEKEPQTTDSQQETKPPEKVRRPWPMWWVVAFIAVYVGIYTYWRFK